MFDFSLLGSFLMDASNLLQFGKGAADLAVDDDETSRSGSRRSMELPPAERQERARQLRTLRQSKQSQAKQRQSHECSR